MSKMVKKLTALVLLTCMLTAALGCGGPKKEKITCTQEQDGTNVEMVLEAEDGKIVKMTQTATMPVEGYSEEQIAAMEEMLNSLKDTFDEIDGVEYSSEKKDDGFELKIVVKTDEETLKAVADQGLFSDLSSEDLDLEDAKKSLEEEGWTIK